MKLIIQSFSYHLKSKAKTPWVLFITSVISIDLINKNHKIRVGVWIGDNKELFDKFYANKDQIESACGFELEWNRLDGKKASYVCTYIPGLDFDSTGNYVELMNKSSDLVLTIRNAFVPFLK